MSRTIRTRRTRIATAAVLAPLALGLVACGSDDDGDDVSTTSTTSSAATSTAPAPSADDQTDDQTDDTQGDQQAGTATLEGDVTTAAETALAEVDGTVFSVDGEPTGWEVTVVTADGEEVDLTLSPDATSVVRGPVTDNDDADDAAERERLLGAALDYAAAMEAALAQVQGTVTGVDLSEDNGTAVWEVQLDEDTPNETTVDVDAQSGEVLATELDD